MTLRHVFHIFLSILGVIGLSQTALSQSVSPGRHVTLHGSGTASYTKVTKHIRHQQVQRGGGFPSTFTVNYNGFSAAQEIAFQYAVDLWADELFEKIPITIDANFTSISGGGLATGGPNSFYSGFTGAPISGANYPVALVNQYEDCDQEPLNADMTININSDSSWYTGVDANPGAGEYDLVTVVMHQIAHGLGIIGTANYDDGSGQCTFGMANDGCLDLTTTAYDRYIENGSGTAITTFTNPSAALGGQLIGDDLFFNGANANSANGSTNPKIEATSTFSQASDYSFLDETTFPAGNANSLITPVIGTAEAIHSPGPILLGMLKDLGWNLAESAAAGIDVRTVFYTGMSLDFNDASSQATSWEWDFNNDGMVDATTQNPSYTFPTAGIYNVRLTINGGASTTAQTIQIFDLPGSYPYIQDFESGIAGFYEISEGCDKWELGAANSTFYTPGNFNTTIGGSASWITNLNSGHGANTEYFLETPPFSFQGAIGDYFLDFDYRFVGLSGPGFNIQFSIDSGQTWTVLGVLSDPLGTNWYTSGSVTGLGGEAGWDVIALSVTHVQRQINLLKGNPDVRFRFKFGALSSTVPDDGVQIDNFTITGNVLPVEDLAFQGTQEGSQVLLTWNTSRELHNDYYQIERSFDGVSFEKLDKIDGNGTTNDMSEYEYTDSSPHTGLNYYRLKQVNQYGSYVYSSPIQVRFSPNDFYTLGPNPAQGFLNLRIFQQQEYEVEFRLLSLTGQIASRFRTKASDNSSHKIDVSNLPSGIYFYELKVGEEQKIKGKVMIE